ncbi:hypothetical protein RFI_07071, partial [Reticulomyxa filosa]
GTTIKLSVQEVTDQMLSFRHSLASVAFSDGKFLTGSLIYRGECLPSSEIWSLVQNINEKKEDFIDWIPHNIKSSIVPVSPGNTSFAGTFITNTTSIKGVFQRISRGFTRMFKKKVFLHWYKSEGVDETEFEESDKNIGSLIIEYQDKQDVIVDPENLDYIEQVDETPVEEKDNE